jgi:integrin beta 3
VQGPSGEKGLDGRDGINGKDGADGLHGKDGLGFDDMEPTYDEVGRLSLRFVRGDLVKSIKVPGIVYRDLWDAGIEYEPGDTVTWGGSMWTAKQAHRGMAPDGLNSKQYWALSVMRGRQGKQGTKGDPGVIGKQGPMGPQGKSGY